MGKLTLVGEEETISDKLAELESKLINKLNKVIRLEYDIVMCNIEIAILKEKIKRAAKKLWKKR